MVTTANPTVTHDGSTIRHIQFAIILDSAISVVSTGQGDAERVIDPTGLVVASGIIDRHAHGRLIPADCMQVFDGVTTTLDLVAGVLPVAYWHRRQADKARVLNYGVAG